VCVARWPRRAVATFCFHALVFVTFCFSQLVFVTSGAGTSKNINDLLADEWRSLTSDQKAKFTA
jgi:hypothetical protein